MSLPRHVFQATRDGSRARLRARSLPVPDTFTYANNVSVAAEIDADVFWTATAPPVPRGFGSTVPSDDHGAFLGHFADARCVGTAGGRETGFAFRTGRMDASGFFAELGHERNGVFL
jgi:hypothetical protein